jgi:hypothetical protein
MMHDDPLQEVLREWKAPEPPAALDARVRAAYRAAYRPWSWSVLWKTRISVPVPALAVLIVLALAWLVQFRSAPAPVPPSAGRGYLTRLDETGFQPLPNGAARVVPVGGIRQ